MATLEKLVAVAAVDMNLPASNIATARGGHLFTQLDEHFAIRDPDPTTPSSARAGPSSMAGGTSKARRMLGTVGRQADDQTLIVNNLLPSSVVKLCLVMIHNVSHFFQIFCTFEVLISHTRSVNLPRLTILSPYAPQGVKAGNNQRGLMKTYQTGHTIPCIMPMKTSERVPELKEAEHDDCITIAVQAVQAKGSPVFRLMRGTDHPKIQSAVLRLRDGTATTTKYFVYHLIALFGCYVPHLMNLVNSTLYNRDPKIYWNQLIPMAELYDEITLQIAQISMVPSHKHRPNDATIRHECGNACCVNISHLKVGTFRENTQQISCHQVLSVVETDEDFAFAEKFCRKIHGDWWDQICWDMRYNFEGAATTAQAYAFSGSLGDGAVTRDTQRALQQIAKDLADAEAEVAESE